MNVYDGRFILCRKCLDRPVDERELMEYLDAYAASLPEAIRVSEDVYSYRLKLCASCPHLLSHMCSLWNGLSKNDPVGLVEDMKVE